MQPILSFQVSELSCDEILRDIDHPETHKRYGSIISAAVNRLCLHELSARVIWSDKILVNGPLQHSTALTAILFLEDCTGYIEAANVNITPHKGALLIVPSEIPFTGQINRSYIIGSFNVARKTQ